jgi:Na+/proline symporter
MLLACTTVISIGAVSTLFYVNLRNTIVQRVRHYVFGIIAFPGALLALFLKGAQTWLSKDALGSTLGAALPVLFLATVIIPAFVFAKEMMGIRSLHLSKLDDEEAVKLWTRQDGLSR